MKSLFRLTTLILGLTAAALGQQVHQIILTKDNYAAVHAQLRMRTPATIPAAGPAAATGFGPNTRPQIGIFYAIMWPTGQAAYEFDWLKEALPPLGCPPDCIWYSDSISFKNIIINVNGKSFTSGPLDEKPYLGIAWFLDSQDDGPRASCQPLTAEGEVGGFMTYRSRCIDVALQLVFPSDPYTFAMPNGQPVTTYGVDTSFIVPALGKADLYSYCDVSNFCGGQTIPVYVHQDLKSEGK